MAPMVLVAPMVLGAPMVPVLAGRSMRMHFAAVTTAAGAILHLSQPLSEASTRAARVAKTTNATLPLVVVVVVVVVLVVARVVVVLVMGAVAAARSTYQTLHRSF
jgi:hypothetical protein